MDVIEGNRVGAVFLFDHIYIVKHLLTSWDDLFEIWERPLFWQAKCSLPGPKGWILHAIQLINNHIVHKVLPKTIELFTEKKIQYTVDKTSIKIDFFNH